MDRARKTELVAQLNDTFRSAALVVVTRQTGLSVAEATDLRRRMRAEGAGYRVTKNRLARRALEGTPHAGLAGLFSGPTAVAWSDDPIAAARAAVEFARKNDKLTIAGGGLAGDMLDEAGVRALAALPSLDGLRAMLVAMIGTPATRLAAVLQAPAAGLARALRARAEEDGAA